MPERERVAGMQPAVLELVDRAEVQVAEVDELADARLVEQPVADDGAGGVPQEPAEDDAERDRGAGYPSRYLVPAFANATAATKSTSEHERRELDVRMHGEHDRPRDEQRAHRPRDDLRHRPPEREPRQQHEHGAEGEAEVLDHSDQRRCVAGREEADALAVRLAAQDERAQAQRPEQQDAHALGRLRPVGASRRSAGGRAGSRRTCARRASRRRRARPPRPGRTAPSSPRGGTASSSRPLR